MTSESLDPSAITYDPQWLMRLNDYIVSRGGIYRAALRLHVHPGTLEKILHNKKVSLPTRKKLLTLIKGKTTTASSENRSESKQSKILKPSLVEKLHQAYNLYQEKGTLEAVGRHLGLTRERVRQILVKGTQLGLFEYKPFDYPYIPREKILEDYKSLLNFNAVAMANNISATYLSKLFTAYNITQKELGSVRIVAHKQRCIDKYKLIMNELGHHPTTTELQRSKSWRYLSIKIPKLWGSFNAFREELKIPKPPHGSPSFSEDTRKWREHKQRLALIARMEHLDRIRECLNASGLVALIQIAYKCILGVPRTRTLMHLLIATGEVVAEGRGAHTQYRLVRDRGER